jgi:hypothetical protein
VDPLRVQAATVCVAGWVIPAATGETAIASAKPPAKSIVVLGVETLPSWPYYFAVPSAKSGTKGHRP